MKASKIVKTLTGFTIPGFEIEMTTFEDETTYEGVVFTIKSPVAWDVPLCVQEGNIAATKIMDKLRSEFYVSCVALQYCDTGLGDNDERVFYVILDGERIYEK